MLAQQAQQLADARQRRGDLVLQRGVGGGAHLVEHVVERVGQRLDVLPVERGDDRVLEAVTQLAQHPVGLLLRCDHLFQLRRRQRQR